MGPFGDLWQLLVLGEHKICALRAYLASFLLFIPFKVFRLRHMLGLQGTTVNVQFSEMYIDL